MIYRVRTRSGREYLTASVEPEQALRGKTPWTSVTLTGIQTGNVVTGNVVIIRGDALESVEIIPDEGQHTEQR